MAVALPTFDHTTSSIQEYVEEIENYMLTHHGECSDARKKAAIMTAIGPDGKQVIKNFSSDQIVSYTTLKQALHEHYKVRNLTFVERNTFYMMFMEDGETVDNYLTRLKSQAIKCDFKITCRHAVPAQAATGSAAEVAAQPAVTHDLTNEFIRDRLIVSINDTATKTRLLQEKTELTLHGAVEIIKSAEEAQRDMKRMLEERAVSHKVVNEISNPQNQRRQHWNNTPATTNNRPQKRGDAEIYCRRYCGKHHLKGKCPAWGATCTGCGRLNHFKEVCRSTAKASGINEVTQHSQANGLQQSLTIPNVDHSTNDWGLFLGMVELECNELEARSEWAEKIQLSGKLIECKIDTGAQANVIAMETLRKSFQNIEIVKSDVTLRAYNNTEIPCVGRVSFLAVLNGFTRHIKFCVVPIRAKTILGLQSSVDLGLVNINSSLPMTDQPSVRECVVTQTKNDRRESEICGASTTPLFSGTVAAEYADLFDNTSLGTIKGEPYDIQLREGSTPVVNATRITPFAIMDKVRGELLRMEKLGVICKVDEPTTWVNSMVVVQRGEKTRICLDPTSLNKWIQREHIILPSADEMLARIKKASTFSKLDLKDGYWQVVLTEEASKLTTFNSPMGRYRYLRLPFGLNSANEVFQKRVSQHIEGIRGAIVLFDDILIHAETPEENSKILHEVFQQCRRAGIKLNPKKCKIGVPEVKYLGHIISAEGIAVDPEKLEDLINMPTPEDRAAVQRLLGSLTYLAKFIPNLATLTGPIRQLLIKNTEFNWTYEHNQAMDDIKECLTTAPVLGFYDVEDAVTISCDASGTGLGACLLQKGRPVAYASRSLTETERSYAQIEKEMLAIVYACDRFYQYIFGKQVICQTDHQPLVTVFDRPFSSNPIRLQRFLIRLQRYDIAVTYVPGKDLPIADMLSRAHVDRKLTDDQLELENDCHMLISSIISNVNCSSSMMQRIKASTDSDITLSAVKQYIVGGWPDDVAKCQLNAKVYWSDRANLAFQEGLLLYQDRIVIPKSLQAEVLSRIHEGHQGQERCKSLARKSVYWKGLNADIERVVSGCNECLLRRKAPAREPLIPHDLPDAPWQKLACDIFSYAGHKYQLIVDYYSKWVEVKRFTGNPTSKTVIEHLKYVFSRFGIPIEIFSDGDSIYTSWEFKCFCVEYEIEHTTSSAHYARSNGQVERKIQFIKNTIAKCSHDKLDAALLSYRATPLGPGLGSPAELLMGRTVRTRIPALVKPRNCDRENVDISNKLLKRQKDMKYYHDRTSNTHGGKTYMPGDLVRYRDNNNELWEKEAQVTSKVNPRSYELINSKGNVVRRNSRFLQPDSTATKLSVDAPEYIPKMNTLPNDPEPIRYPLPLPSPALPMPDRTPLTPEPPAIRRSERIRLRTMANQRVNN